ncbi:MAG: hypothetical protein U9N42_06455 [Campylobacterota bacterium]|nr:hypothetical protein [Campylobacterota bacterium]
MSKRIINSERITQIINNIAQDFRFSNELGEYALLFYKADSEKVVKGADIDKMIEYIETGLEELENAINFKQEYLSENPNMDEISMLNNMKTIEEEYVELLKFLK